MKFEQHFIHFLSGALLLLYALNSVVVAALTQEQALEIALDYLLNDNQDSSSLTQPDASDMVVKNLYATQHNGVTHIYLSQKHKDIELVGCDTNVHVAKDGSVISADNRLISNLDQLVNTTGQIISASQAIQSAAQHLGLNSTTEPVVKENIGGTENLVIFTGGDISLDDIYVRLAYYCLGPGEIRLAWELIIRRPNHWWNMWMDAVSGKVISKSDWVVNHNDYKVLALPSVSPEDPGVPPSLVNAPADATASPFGWHDTDGVAGAEFTDTRGNNVFAQEDRDGNNTGGFRPDGGTDLVFDFAWDPTLEPWEGTNQEAAIVNLFYWNNVIHDVVYHYGFDEASGNFQENNYGKGGLGGDSVQADAQDGYSTNNANFATPPDGQNPRMQMFLWDKTSPQRDGDFDNTTIIHEYVHGISMRLVGGASNVNCLGNAEQMGEGWSDWLALVLTTVEGEDGADARGIAPYLMGQAPDGQGIRTARYTTDMNENGYTYGDIGNSLTGKYGVGLLWATMLWEMQWKLIGQHGFDSDVYTGNGGNNLAIQLVIDGMKFTDCNPGFVDARDAILQADETSNGGANQCLIWEAFAKRGLGYSADQGSTSSITDGTEAFDLPPECLKILKISHTASPSPVEAGALLDYSLEVRNDTANTLTGVTITDNLPANTSYVSATCGGSESGGVVTFPLGTMNSGDTASCSFQVQVSATLKHTVLFADDMESGEDNWTVSHGQGQNNWTLGNSNSHSGSYAWFAQDKDVVTDQYLIMSNQLPSSGRLILRFWHHYDTESGFDGGVVEISTDGGATWTDLGSKMTQNGYNGSISSSYGSPIGGSGAFTGNSGDYIETLVDLSSYSGQNVQIRFRLATDTGTGGNGWYVDDVQIVDEAAISNEACVEADSGESHCASVLTPVIPVASVAVSPDSLVSSQATDTQTTQVLNIENTGGVDLVWTIDEAASDCSSPEDISWLGASASSGTIVPADSLAVDVVFDSAGLNLGVYEAKLCINSNDSVVEVPVSLEVIRVDLIADFGPPYGIYALLHDGSWLPLNSVSADSMVTGDLDGNGQVDAIVDFGYWDSDNRNDGEYDVIWVWLNHALWVPLHEVSPKSMVTGDIDGNGQVDVIIDFGVLYGIWVWMNNNYWVQLHTVSAISMVTGDIDGNGQGDGIIDFGYGDWDGAIWALMNNSEWVKFHDVSPKSMVTGDMDGNGQDDGIIDFGYGDWDGAIWVWRNNSTWVQLHSLSARSMVAGK